jgi:predicted nucleic-acid-binding Zn-ribbon protein
MVTVKIYKINPKFANYFNNWLLRIGNRGVEYRKESFKEDEFSLKFYIMDKIENKYGIYYETQIDEIIILYNVEKKEFPNKVSKPVSFQVYNKDNVENYLGVFYTGNNLKLFLDVISNIFNEKKILYDVRFELYKKKSDLTEIFKEIKEFRAKNLLDDLEKDVSIRGIQLQDSTAWHRYIEYLEGELENIRVKYGNIYVTISSRGVISSRHKDFEEKEVEYTYNILKDLIKVGVIRVLQEE